jgi:hypothetical protein
MKRFIFCLLPISILTFGLYSCEWPKGEAKNVMRTTSEVVDESSSKSGNDVYNGIDNKYEYEVKISSQLKTKGIQISEVLFNLTDTPSDNVITTYIIFNQTFDEQITIKLFNQSGDEYGRLSKNVKGEKGDSQHYDFKFDKSVRIGLNDVIVIE